MPDQNSEKTAIPAPPSSKKEINNLKKLYSEPELYKALIMQLTEKELFTHFSLTQNVQKNVLVGYLLLIFLGIFGAHKIYTGDIGVAVVYILLLFTASLVVPLLLLLLFLFCDLFSLSEQIQKQNRVALASAALEIVWARTNC